MLGCGNRSQPSVITANTKLMEQMDSIIGDIYERDTIKVILMVMEILNMLIANQTLLNITALIK